MATINASLNPVLDALDDIYNALQDNRLEPDSLELCKDQIKVLSNFFQCSKEQAALLGLMLYRHFNGEENTVRELISHLGLNLSFALNINKTLEPLVRKEWLKPSQDLRYNPFTGYDFNKKFLHSVITIDWTHMEGKPISNSLELLEHYGADLASCTNRQIDFYKLMDRSYQLITNHEALDLPAFILELDLEPSDCAVFLYLCYQHYKGQELVNLDCIMNDLKLSLKDQFVLRNSIRSEKHVFFEHGLVELSEAGIMECSENLKLTHEAIRHFSQIGTAQAKKFESAFLTEISPERIKEKTLIYNDTEGGILARIGQVLEPDNFENFTERMKGKGMRPGVTALLYGHPGTGKTETVYQMARTSGRAILMADASSLRDKWLGQTEKNIRGLFRDYKKGMKHFDEVPILLFNEADSIMTKRRRISDKIDQMENTLQNILLQELENFEGIFIATTNLESNLDPAFDRRLLFKVRFAQPEISVRAELWMQKMPELELSLANRIAEHFALSGGQIDNICKKVQMESLFDSGVKLSYEYLEELIRQEMCLQNTPLSDRSPIGFKVRLKT